MQFNGYLTVKDTAEKWGVTLRRVQGLCNEGKVKGAIRFGRAWMIPVYAVLPGGAKINEEPHLPMPKKSPFLDMTSLYSVAGTADECVEMLVNNPEAYALFEAQIDYRRGDIDRVYRKARYFLSSHSGFYAILGGSMLLAMCAIWKGDIKLWREAKRHLFEAPAKTPAERDIILLTLAIVDSSVYHNSDYPSWFTVGNFELLPPDSHPAAKVFYAKYLYMAAYGVASKQIKIEGVQGLALMKMLPNTLEPMITQAVVDKTLLTEICLRLSAAVSYYNTGDKKKAIEYIDKAVELALPDKLYGLLAEYLRHFDGLLENRVALVDSSAAEKVAALYKIYSDGWNKLVSDVRNRNIVKDLTPREREISKLSVFGFSVKEIAAMLGISESTVKQTLLRAIQKAKIVDRSQLVEVL